MFDKVSYYYSSQVFSFENINYNNESNTCEKPVVEISLSSNTFMNFGSSLSTSVSTHIISFSLMMEQRNRRNNDINKEKILILRR